MAFEKINEFAADKQKLCVEHDTISDELFREYGVNRGLRDINGKGVLTGLTRISKVVSFKDENGEHVPCDGELWYRGYNINTLIKNLDGFGFEKTAYLLIFGEMPTAQQLAEFNDVLTECRTLPSNFTRDVIMKAPSKDIMNSMTKSILTLSSYDDDIASNSIDNCIRQCLQLTAVFPMLAVYGYHAYNHYENDDSMYIHRPTTGLSTAENFLRLLRPDMQYTELEARVLDIVLMLHMEHGGGNNSTFTTRVVTSSGSDTYSAIAAAMSSLKGPRHGGANLKQAREVRHNGLGGLALGQRRNEISGLGPAGQLHAHRTTLAVAFGLGIMLPHLVAGERQNRAHDAHEHLEDVHEHGLSRAARH